MSVRWTYALPLEIIYLSPLANWNPLNLAYSEDCTINKGRSGSPINADKAFLATCPKQAFARTPMEFYSDDKLNKSPEDTTNNAVGILKDGAIQLVKQSGTWVTMPSIDGVGVVRQRYPIAPAFEDGSTVMKEVKALSRITFYEQLDDPHKVLEREAGSLLFRLTTANNHEHTVYLPLKFAKRLMTGKKRQTVVSSEEYGHSHDVVISYNAATSQFVMESISPKEPHTLELMA